jgi:hypothetical protein
MKHIAYIIALFSLTACEIFTIGTEAPVVVPVDQKSAVGSTFLFKAGLDSNNVYAVTQLLTSPDGMPMLGVQKYSYFEDIARYSRLIGNKPITNVITDSLTDAKIKVDVEFDYLKSFSFTTELRDERWFITSFIEHPSIIFDAPAIKTNIIKCR